MRRVSRACLVGVALISLLSGCASATAIDSSPTVTPSAPTLSGMVPPKFRFQTITVSTGMNNPPLYFSDPSGTPQGLTQDIAESAAELLGLTLDIRPARFDTVIPELQSGTIDAAIYAMDVTDQRAERIDMVAYFEGGHHVMTHQNHLDLRESFDSLCGLTLGGIAGSSWVQSISELSARHCTIKKPIIAKEYVDQASANRAVKKLELDGVVISSIAGEYAVEKDPAWSLTGPKIAVTPVGMGFTKGSGLGEAFTVAVNELIENGTYETIFQKYGVSNLALTHASLNPQSVSEPHPLSP